MTGREAGRWLLQGHGGERTSAAEAAHVPLLGRSHVAASGGGGGSGSGSFAVPVPSLLERGWSGAPQSPLARRRQRSVAEGLGSPADKAVGDDYKEAQRRKQRTVFNFVRWKQHRSSKRYWRHMFGGGEPLPDSDCNGAGVVAARKFDLPSKLRTLAGPLVYVFVLSTLTAAYHALAAVRPLSLCIASRPQWTNASYARFLDARKAWGSVTNRSRDLARQGLAYLPPGQHELAALLCRWIVAFSHSMMCWLREEGDESQGLSGVLPPSELDALLAADHRPLFALQVLASVVAHAQQAWLQQGQPTVQQQQQQGPQQQGQDAGFQGSTAACLPSPAVGMQLAMDGNLTALEDALGTCERILRTPIPLGYTRHTSRFLMIWLTLLPFTLWDSCRWAMLPIAILIAFLLLGIEEIGVQIEEPFSILPLCHICRTIRRNVEELLEAHSSDNKFGPGMSSGKPSAAGLVEAVLMRQREAAEQLPPTPLQPGGT
ncbi:UPF0187 chloroplastic [Chlorella sorokiniana]|uniref:UPF0187 chloroplastic n=1 Tax=Chlorella sorokiniana TaxID=3076 RepID=A0A2P6TS37_CHLSO|nr:UPF0187 chloroplastic [Chlorella sorokiniana]|eukprot:PRW56885.1 UPF0187 chloroplastic [Chlorella sorokiniana]